jgi:GNAT superfamily N-acetyltransferase
MPTIAIRAGEAPEVVAFLAERIYEYNAAVTGYHDGESFSVVYPSESANPSAGAAGYTWGGCCFVSYLWVAEQERRKGLGSALLAAIERHAQEKHCTRVLLATHSFQAPNFYAGRGYQQVARVSDHPIGHASIFYAKQLAAQ